MLLAAELGPIPRVKALCGGEAWDGQLAEQLLARTREVWNMYGPTETTVWSSIQKVEPGRSVCLGDPIGNTRFYVFDESMQPVQPGEIGELFIGGDGLAKGYLNRPELTRERFVPNPLRPEEVIYKTGILSGMYEFIGRVDEQVKIRGFRVELGEIESHLNRLPGVRESVVVLKADAANHPVLIAFWIPTDQAPLPSG